MKRKNSWTFKYVLLFGILMLLANILLGLVLENQARSALQTLTERNMLSLAGSAADLLDGDAIERFTAADTRSGEYLQALSRLTAFQINAEIDYIYVVRQEGEGRYVYVLDPDPVAPADFGEESVWTEALEQAAHGVATVDRTQAEDRWGSLSSAYSPIYGRDRHVAAVVGVDFNSDWYNAQTRQLSLSITIVTVSALVIGALLVTLFTGRARKRFNRLNEELTALGGSIDELTKTITSGRGYSMTSDEAISLAATGIGADGDATDEISIMDSKLRSMRQGMERYLEFVRAQTFTDALTRVGNTTAYQELVKELNGRIAAGNAAFAIAMFDINSLKQINDEHSHSAGDEIIRAAASVIEAVFGRDQTYRIGGDEFVALSMDTDEAVLAEKLAAVEANAAAYNVSARQFPVDLSLSVGTAVFRPEEDTDYRHLFNRADEAMYESKHAYYLSHGDRRRS